ncbi:MAG: fumarylacetoacetate hydrolase family protein [Campylobacteraceae bacterium]|nr:fumarylacetoacetate hydrolase family protein [Campylobacteraceae bacterium]
MRYLRYSKNNKTYPGVEVDNIIYNISSIVNDITNKTIEFLSNLNIDYKKLEIVKSYDKLLAPIDNVGKIVCIGLNYSDHAKESGMKLPSEPVVFMKATSSICGPYDDIELPKNSSKTDWEIELALVISKDAKYIDEKDAYDYIAGYTILNDISEREFQLEREAQWTKGKSHDTFSPIGPYIITQDEVGDENNLNMLLKIDDKIFQNSNSKQLYFKIPFIISYLSQLMTLKAGDIITTGTPSGVGLGLSTPIYLKDKQTMHLSIDKLGFQKQTAYDYK